VRLFAPARIRLKRALALHEPSANDARARRQEPPFYAAKSMVKRTFNGSEALPRVSIRGECVRVLLLRASQKSNSDLLHACLVCPQSFPHLWKNLWKIARFSLSEHLA
jgi:hypothetical protein